MTPILIAGSLLSLLLFFFFFLSIVFPRALPVQEDRRLPRSSAGRTGGAEDGKRAPSPSAKADEKEPQKGTGSRIARCAILSHFGAQRCRRRRADRLLQHGVQLVGQVIEHAADVVEDAHGGFFFRTAHTE